MEVMMDRSTSHAAASTRDWVKPRLTTSGGRRFFNPHRLPSRLLALAQADNTSSENSAVVVDDSQVKKDQYARVITKFIAETLLPTRHGKFRLRGYKHSIDGGATFTEPTAIIFGAVEGQFNTAWQTRGPNMCKCKPVPNLANNLADSLADSLADKGP
eukprot:gene4530-14696_t